MGKDVMPDQVRHLPVAIGFRNRLVAGILAGFSFLGLVASPSLATIFLTPISNSAGSSTFKVVLTGGSSLDQFNPTPGGNVPGTYFTVYDVVGLISGSE